MGTTLEARRELRRSRRSGALDLSWRRGRRLVVVDLENVVGGLCATEAMTRWGKRFLDDSLGLLPHDLVVVGVDGRTMPLVAWDWERARIVPGRAQKDGADLALLEVLDEDVARRFDEVVLVSGDGIFADIVASLIQQGVKVTVAAHESALSLELQLAASELILLSRIAQHGGIPDPRSA